jgi:hypothetical protein
MEVMSAELPLSGHRPVLDEAKILSGCTCGWPAPAPTPEPRTAFILETLGANTTPYPEPTHPQAGR